ncbi:MAG: hypothetical protein IR159_09810 [Brevundimonas sp.]|nr:hypothetical protein [Brevundimonas sp.]
MKRLACSIAAAAAAMFATPAAAQLPGTPGQGAGYSTRDVLAAPHESGIIATTPSRIGGSRREMNRGRRVDFERRMSSRQARLHARDLIQRADIQCEVGEAMLVAVTEQNIPVIEVDCADSGGLVIADTLPIQATDCLDWGLGEGAENDVTFLTCQLPGNVATVAAAAASQSSRN